MSSPERSEQVLTAIGLLEKSATNNGKIVSLNEFDLARALKGLCGRCGNLQLEINESKVRVGCRANQSPLILQKNAAFGQDINCESFKSKK